MTRFVGMPVGLGGRTDMRYLYMRRRRTGAHLAAGRRVGTGLVGKLEARVIELRHLDDTVSSAHLLPVVLTELDQAQELIRTASYPDSLGTRLLTVVGELAQLSAWVASDAGRYHQAQRLYLSGVTAAQAAGDRPLRAQLLSS